MLVKLLYFNLQRSVQAVYDQDSVTVFRVTVPTLNFISSNELPRV